MHLHLSDQENKAKDEKENNDIYTFKKCLLVLDGDMKDKNRTSFVVVCSLHAFKI